MSEMYLSAVTKDKSAARLVGLTWITATIKKNMSQEYMSASVKDKSAAGLVGLTWITATIKKICLKST
jgi:hypothetical protein